MPTELELNVDLILQYLVNRHNKSKSNESVTGNDIRLATGLEPYRINQAIELMKSDGLIEREQTYSTAPFMFHSIKLIAKGADEFERKSWQKLLNPFSKLIGPKVILFKSTILKSY